MNDDAGEELLSGIDLHKWQVPPPPAGRRAEILVRALAPATTPKRRRMAWLIVGIITCNAIIATIIAVVVARPAAQTIVAVRPAGGGSADAQMQELLRRLDEEHKELERRLAELDEVRALAQQLMEKLRRLEQREKHDRPTPKRDPVTPMPEPALTCDEVSCVLESFASPCCAKFRAPASGLAANLDRSMISAGIAAVRDRVMSCANPTLARGSVKLRIEVNGAGIVIRVAVQSTPDPALAACVAQAVQRARFEKTQSGGSFTYPFVF